MNKTPTTNYFKVMPAPNPLESGVYTANMTDDELQEALGDLVARRQKRRPKGHGEPVVFFNRTTVRQAWADAMALAGGDADRISVWQRPIGHGPWQDILEIGETPEDRGAGWLAA